MTNKEAIEFLKNIIDTQSVGAVLPNGEKALWQYHIEALNMAISALQSHWIPCSERLPEAECGESESVLVCFENGTQDVIYFNGGNWCYPTGETYISRNYKNGWHNEVVAWMPLPEPYRKDGEADG